jgi:hypothetical protein
MWQWWIGLPWNVWLDQTQKLSQIVAIVVGGIWAYTKFFRGRVFYTRLEPSVTGQVFRREEADYLLVFLRLKNVGIAKVDIEQKGTALRVFGCGILADRSPKVLNWDRLHTLAIMAQHAWIEASETIDDTLMIVLPKNLIAVKLEMRVVANSLEWHARHIVISSDTKAKGETQ